jgi:cyclic beta-1,2-glucan synthetase
MRRATLSGRIGAALDPCAALQIPFSLGPGEEKEVVFLLGETDGPDMARELLRRYREPGQARGALEAIKARWEGVLSAVQVETPDPAFDLLLNRWLPYQVLSCRVWGRSALYQSGGAYGFRDQLQDVMALVYGAPGETRAQILRASARQFVEGDVQHWWHPPTGRGVRTRISDDFLWLPFVVAHYVKTTGDSGILDERVPFLEAPPLAPGQEDDYGLPAVAPEPGTVYDHCVRALEHGMQLGALGLPLMGTGDWNDGMNRVGAGGKGESVWLAWFLLTTLRRFAPLAEARGDSSRAETCRAQAEALRAAVEANAWDGHWYRRATFDDGTPLGSATNDECQIDALAQSWAVISGDALALFNLINPIRHADAPAAVDHYKVEPYVVAGDVYGRPPHTGRGGWTWYTGSAAWLYRVGIETLLGFHREGDRLVLDPRIPADWPRFTLTYRHRSATYRITIENPDRAESGLRRLTLDGRTIDGNAIPLADDGQTHDVHATMG